MKFRQQYRLTEQKDPHPITIWYALGDFSHGLMISLLITHKAMGNQFSLLDDDRRSPEKYHG